VGAVRSGQQVLVWIAVVTAVMQSAQVGSDAVWQRRTVTVGVELAQDRLEPSPHCYGPRSCGAPPIIP
jgi:hypothetical protein